LESQKPLEIAEAGYLLREGAVSATDLTIAALEKIAERPELNTYISVMRESALRDAETADDEIARGELRGPLHGVPVGIKDNVDVVGEVTTAASRVRGDVAPGDAAVVASLRAAGAVILGKHNMHEFAMGVTSENSSFGSVSNPWDPNRTSGGSSGGSAAAVAAGQCVAAVGTDTAGSIRIPAAFCGVVGLKPTTGALSLTGVVPLSWSLDHVGPITLSARDALLMLEAMGFAHGQLTTVNPRQFNVAVPSYALNGPMSDEVRASFEGCFSRLVEMGCHLHEVEIPELKSALVCDFVIALSEAASYHSGFRTAWASYSVPAQLALAVGLEFSAVEYLKAQRARQALRLAITGVLSTADVILMPTVPVAAPHRGSRSVTVGTDTLDLDEALVHYTAFANLTGNPAITVPAGLTAGGLPIGMQLIGRHFEDRRLCLLADHLQRSLPPTQRFGTHSPGQ